MLAEVSLDADPLPVDTVTKMLGLSKPIDLWITYLLSLNVDQPMEHISVQDIQERDVLGSAPTDTSWEEVGVAPTLEDFERARAMLHTPKRLKVGPLLASLVDTSPSGGAVLDDIKDLESLPDEPTQEDREDHTRDSLAVIIDEWNKVKANFGLLNSELRTQGASESKFRDVLAGTISSMQSVIHDSDAKIQLLVSRIGESREASDEGSLTCWDAVKQLQEGLETIKANLPVTAQLVEQLEKSGEGTAARLNNLGKSFENMAAHYRSTITNINDQLGRLSRLTSGTTPSYGGVLGMQFGSTPGDLGADMVALRQRVKELEDHARQSGRPVNRHETVAVESLTRDIRDLEARIGSQVVGGGNRDHLERSMEVMRAKMKEMEGRVTDASFRLNQFTFSTFYEVKTWCEENSVTTYGTFWDLSSVLVAMKPKYQTGKDMADERYSSARIKSTPFENDLLASMSHPRPLALFGKKGGELAGMNEGFGACQTYEQWVGSGCDSVKAILTTQLMNFCAGVVGTLDFAHPATSFITALLTEVQLQWNHMVACIETFHNDLLYVAKFTKAKAWQLLGRTIGAIFEAMAGPRAEVARLSDGTDLHSKASLIWAVLRCHRIMQQFIDVRFRGHPAIVKEMTLFMLTERVDPSEIGLLVERVKEAEAKGIQAQKIAMTLEKDVAVLKRNYDNLMNEIKQLKAKK